MKFHIPLTPFMSFYFIAFSDSSKAFPEEKKCQKVYERKGKEKCESILNLTISWGEPSRPFPAIWVMTRGCRGGYLLTGQIRRNLLTCLKISIIHFQLADIFFSSTRRRFRFSKFSNLFPMKFYELSTLTFWNNGRDILKTLIVTFQKNRNGQAINQRRRQ